MKTFKQYNEALETPYKMYMGDFSWGRRYEFETDDGRKAAIYIEYRNDEEMAVEFSLDGTQATTGKGDAFKIFASVKKAILDTMKAKPHVSTLSFSAAKGTNTGEKPDGRIRLYKRFAKMLGQKLKMKVTQFAKDYSTSFTLER
jgi:hypothetical protein